MVSLTIPTRRQLELDLTQLAMLGHTSHALNAMCWLELGGTRVSIHDSSNRPDLPASSTLKIMALRRPGVCGCGAQIAADQRAGWDRSTRTVHCLSCVGPPASGPTADSEPVLAREPESASTATARYGEPPPVEVGLAGGSVQHEYDRRHARREQRIRTAHPRLGGLILALSDDPQSTRAWQSGAVGERRLAERLAGLGDTVIALHDRRLPKSRANIDHIVVGPGGVYVIDAKRYKNAKIAVRRSGGLFGPTRQQLMVAGRDKTKLAAAMEWQVTAVRAALGADSEFAHIPITSALCFIDAEFPLFGTIEIGDVRVRGLKGTARLVAPAGPFDAATRDRLARTSPPATGKAVAVAAKAVRAGGRTGIRAKPARGKTVRIQQHAGTRRAPPAAKRCHWRQAISHWPSRHRVRAWQLICGLCLDCKRAGLVCVNAGRCGCAARSATGASHVVDVNDDLPRQTSADGVLGAPVIARCLGPVGGGAR